MCPLVLVESFTSVRVHHSSKDSLVVDRWARNCENLDLNPSHEGLPCGHELPTKILAQNQNMPHHGVVHCY